MLKKDAWNEFLESIKPEQKQVVDFISGLAKHQPETG